MRYLTLNYAQSALNRGKSIEQFIGKVTREGNSGIRFIQITLDSASYQLTTFDVEDIGSEDFLDIYSFPTLIEDEYYDRPSLEFRSLEDAFTAAHSNYSASSDCWTNAGVVQDEYKDFLVQNRSAEQDASPNH